MVNRNDLPRRGECKWVPFGQLKEQILKNGKLQLLELQLIAEGFAAFELGDDSERVVVE